MLLQKWKIFYLYHLNTMAALYFLRNRKYSIVVETQLAIIFLHQITMSVNGPTW